MIVRKIAAALMILTIVSSGFLIGIEGVHATPTNPVPTDDSEQGEQAEEEEDPYEFVFSDNLRIVDAEWQNGVWVAVFEAETTTEITVYEIPTEDSVEGTGSGFQPYNQTHTISSDGTTEVQFERPSGAAGVQIWENNLYMNYDPDRTQIDIPPESGPSIQLFTGMGSSIALFIATIGGWKLINKWRIKPIA